MLKDTLYKIISSSHHENSISAVLEINKDSEIFIGHFPGHPVLPGACMLQIVKEVLESSINVSLKLRKADNMKFLVMISPVDNSILELLLSYTRNSDEGFDVTASLSSQKDVCFKFKGYFIAR